jgi:glycosyltransferase involved in cell wall biosynthesis
VDETAVAVIIPCYNDGALVSETIASVQQLDAVEIVVVDDGSPDPVTRQVIDDLPEDVKVVRHPVNLGVGASRNAGIAVTAAPLIFPLDADDVADPGAIAAMREALARDPDAGVVYGDYLEFGDHELLRAVPERLDAYRLLWTNEYPPTALWRRSALEAIGGYSEGRYYYEDWDLWLRAAEAGVRAVHMGAGFPTYRQRVHGPRLLEMLKLRHRNIYKELRTIHAGSFAARADLRRQSDLSPLRKRLYPLVYGSRPRLAVEAKVKAALDRLGLWTLRR